MSRADDELRNERVRAEREAALASMSPGARALFEKHKFSHETTRFSVPAVDGAVSRGAITAGEAQTVLAELRRQRQAPPAEEQ